MSLEKAIEHGREHRAPYYRRCEKVDRSCRPGGDCPHCQANRRHAVHVAADSAEYELDGAAGQGV